MWLQADLIEGPVECITARHLRSELVNNRQGLLQKGLTLFPTGMAILEAVGRMEQQLLKDKGLLP